MEVDSDGEHCGEGIDEGWEKAIEDVKKYGIRVDSNSDDICVELPCLPTLPCPFCGGVAELNLGGFGERYVTCADNSCGGRLGDGVWFNNDEDVVELWNGRA